MQAGDPPTTVLEGAPNFRDLGGLPVGDGRRIRHGLIYRSESFITLTEDDVNRLVAVDLRVVCDLRSAADPRLQAQRTYLLDRRHPRRHLFRESLEPVPALLQPRINPARPRIRLPDRRAINELPRQKGRSELHRLAVRPIAAPADQHVGANRQLE